MEKSPSAGKTVAIGSGATGSLIIIFMYLSKHYGLEDMTLEVASAFVTVAVMLAGGIMHEAQRRGERNAAASLIPGDTAVSMKAKE